MWTEKWVKKNDMCYMCSYDGCTYSSDDPYGVGMHYMRVHEKKGPQKKNKLIDERKKKDICEHIFVLLNKKDGRHKRALEAGYLAYCKKCGDLDIRGDYDGDNS